MSELTFITPRRLNPGNLSNLARQGAIFAILVWVATTAMGLPPKACLTAGITALTAFWWVTEALPIPATSLVPLAAFPIAGVLNNRQIANGYVLLCVARATTDCTLEIGVESHDKLYRNPFLDPLEPHELKADIATPKEM